ncbi:uncharacterized protein CEXT_694131 [Caerostris extrusa]|uniref:Uncharacterized protein n=1 Tax=Caerostris extrusa TaxID=172846 RepID=A0AAV4M2R8_CAEEX|nr:uncharacterized protein CEXT_694131 [Caerostris extrusa]
MDVLEVSLVVIATMKMALSKWMHWKSLFGGNHCNEDNNVKMDVLEVSLVNHPITWLISLSANEIKAVLIALVLSNMADVFLTEDYEDCVDESNEIESLEIETETDLISDSQNLLNSDCEDLNEPVMDNSDMTLKQGVSEPELFAAEDMLVNPE